MCCCPLPSSSGRSPANGSVTRSPPRRRRACGWAATCPWATTRASAHSPSTLPRPRPCVASSPFIVSSAACAGSRRRPTASASARSAARRLAAPSAAADPSRADTSTICCRTPSTSVRSRTRASSGQHPALIDAETWTAVRDQLVTNATNHRRKADAAEPSLLAGVLTDARGERFTPSHAVKKGRRYRYYVSTALITEAGTDQSQGWRLPAQEIEDAVIRVLADALTHPALLPECFGMAIPSDQTRKMLDRAIRLAAVLKRSPAERAKVVRDLIEKVVIEENTITISMRRSSLSGGAVVPPSSENPSDSPIELTAPVAFRRRGTEMRLVLPR